MGLQTEDGVPWPYEIIAAEKNALNAPPAQIEGGGRPDEPSRPTVDRVHDLVVGGRFADFVYPGVRCISGEQFGGENLFADGEATLAQIYLKRFPEPRRQSFFDVIEWRQIA